MIAVERIQVYSSYAYAVEPRAFYVGELEHRVAEITRAWKTPGCVHFYVRDEQHELFELRYDQVNDRWFLRTFGETCRVAPTSLTRSADE